MMATLFYHNIYYTDYKVYCKVLYIDYTFYTSVLCNGQVILDTLNLYNFGIYDCDSARVQEHLL